MLSCTTRHRHQSTFSRVNYNIPNRNIFIYLLKQQYTLLGLKDLRKKHNKTQEEVCKEIKISQSTLSKIENSDYESSLKKYLKYFVEKGEDINVLFKNK